MKNRLIIGLFLALTLLMATALAGKPNLTPALANVNPSKGQAEVVIPENAVEVAPGIFSIGTAVSNGKTVEGLAFVDYVKGFARGGKGGTGASSCYGFLARGAKWKTVEPYVVNPDNTSGVDTALIATNLAANIAKWETAAGKDILGEGSVTTETLAADTTSPDNQNEMYFGSISEPGAIAVTIVWGIFGGPPQTRELVEWDQVYDQADYAWSATGEAGKMDFENIATHELGHSVGLSDLYESTCAEQTMYGYADYGETKKRTLEAGDIKGIQELYK
ncbi:MAG: matrixin family metalloprotease [Candidatus Diapherotrites archaeon]|nr:matrixin family metalloprotease [Candidatus Diapherotrites archaeon]